MSSLRESSHSEFSGQSTSKKSSILSAHTKFESPINANSVGIGVGNNIPSTNFSTSNRSDNSLLTQQNSAHSKSSEINNENIIFKTPLASESFLGLGTSVTSTTTSRSRENQILMAICEGRGQARGDIGIAYYSIQCSTLILSQFSDTQTYSKVLSKINIFKPIDILMSSTLCDAVQPSRIFLLIKNEFPNISIVPLQRRIYNDKRGLDRIKHLVAEPYSSVLHQISQKYYALSAAAALFKYIEVVFSCIIASNSLKVELHGCDDIMLIDISTAKHLELLSNNMVLNSNQSLFGILNSCRTPGGTRLLRMNLLQPPSIKEVIEERLDCVEKLISCPEIICSLQATLGRFPIDLEHLISTLIQIPQAYNDKFLEQRINNIIALKHVLCNLPILISILDNLTDINFFGNGRETLSTPIYGEIYTKIEEVINCDSKFQKNSSHMKIERIFAVKADVNPFLDISRRSYCQIKEEINNYTTALSEQYNMSIKLAESKSRGLFFQHFILGKNGDKRPPPNLPTIFLQVHRQKNVLTFKTEQLLICDKRMKTLIEEIQNMSDKVISNLISTIRADIGSLYKMSEFISMLDVLVAFSNYAISSASVKPTFSEFSTSIIKGNHPILDAISPLRQIPNNAYISESTNFVILTGPNMSGKTTYLKQVALLQILAQIGCYVCAKSATFRIMKQLFSRIGNGDNTEQGYSTFYLEMTEISYILKNLDENSLVIIDELGRSTSCEEGAAISWAISEALISSKAFILFATHYLFLSKLESLYFRALNYEMQTKEIVADENLEKLETRLSYTHSIRRGVTNIENYGLKLAKRSGFPIQVVNNAEVIAMEIVKNRKKKNNKAVSHYEKNQKTLFLLGVNLKQFANCISQSTDISLIRQYLVELQDEVKTNLKNLD